jgi:hypothetical protein
MTHWSLINVLFSFNCMHIFCCCFCFWVLVLVHCAHIECLGLFLFSYIFWGFICVLIYDPFLKNFHRLLRRMYIVCILNEIFWRHQLGPFDLRCTLVLEFLYWFFAWVTYLLVIAGVLKSPTSTVLEYRCVFKLLEYVWWNWVHWHWVHIGC